MFPNQGGISNEKGKYLNDFTKMGVEKEGAGSTVQFPHRTLSTALKDEWENRPH